MTKMEMAILGREFKDNYYSKYHEEVVVFYKYRGEARTRTELRLTEEGRTLLSLTHGEKLFTCPCCGEKKSFGDLEVWNESAETIAEDKVECSQCYEEAMGEDL